MPLAPGSLLDRYVIADLLGSGGMGEVYRARDTRLERDVALKVLSATTAGTAEGAARMLREARAAAALHHPNVVAVFDVGEVVEPAGLRGTTYIAMELIRGRPLRAFVRDAAVSIAERALARRRRARARGRACGRHRAP